jgi:Rrf2 family protein
MELTREADYAVRLMVDLADRPGPGQVRSADIARRQMIPPKFLAKVVQRLSRAGFVHTRRGTGGGVMLARRPRDITLRGVIEAIEGPIRLNRCAVDSDACPLARRCSVHPVWQRLQAMVTDELERTTVEALRRRRTG